MRETNEEQKARKPDSADTAQLLLTMADTTWRMFIPTALFVSGGIFADLNLGTAPWLTFVSVVIGLASSVLLVRKQLRKIK